MFVRFLISASVLALLSAAPSVAQEATQQPIIKPQPNATGDTQGKMPEANQAQPEVKPDANAENQQPAAGDQDQNANAAVKKNAATSESGSESETVDDQTQTKKKDQNAATGEAEQNATETTSGTKKKKSEEATKASNGKAGKVTAEKKTIIREKIVTRNVTKIDRSEINFNLSVGVAVPATIVVNPLPVEVIEVVPEYQGYLYFVLADGMIVIVEPGSLQIVAMIG